MFYSDTANDTDIPAATNSGSADITEIDACGLSCPEPVLKLSKSMKKIEVGSIVRVIATDSGFAADVRSWCKKTGNRLIAIDNKNAKYIVTAKKC